MTTLRDTYDKMLRAASFAARAHQGQFRKDGDTPYASHPFRVTLIVRDVFGIADKKVLTAALLHDTIEDTTTDYDDLVEQFDAEVACWVAALSKDKRLEDNTREAEYMRVLQNAPWQVHVCKLADVFDNLMDRATMPLERHDHVARRARMYIDAIAAVASAPVQRPLELVNQLYTEIVG